jgi:hypothetical protein
MAVGSGGQPLHVGPGFLPPKIKNRVPVDACGSRHVGACSADVFCCRGEDRSDRQLDLGKAFNADLAAEDPDFLESCVFRVSWVGLNSVEDILRVDVFASIELVGNV